MARKPLFRSAAPEQLGHPHVGVKTMKTFWPTEQLIVGASSFKNSFPLLASREFHAG